MSQSLLDRAVLRLRTSLPALLALFAIVFFPLPFGVPALSAVGTVFAVCTVFYWSIYRPDVMPAAATFAIGLVLDLLGGGPIGAMALVLVALSALAVSQRRAFAGKSHMIIWFGFILIALPAALLLWLILCLHHVALLDPRPVLAGYVLAVAVYPLVSELFNLLRPRLMEL